MPSPQLLPQLPPQLPLAPPVQRGRRQFPRLRLAMPARLITLADEVPAMLVDLSRSGAAVQLRSPPSAGCDAILTWGRYEGFGRICWSEHGLCGMAFDSPLPEAVVLATRSLELPPDERASAIAAAEAWAKGHGATRGNC